MKKSSFCLGLIGLVALSFISPQKAMALKPEYLRNGECYLLIGEGTDALRGVYRLNNPEKDKYYKDNKVITGSQINNTLGFNVDLDRVIYTFTETKDTSWSIDPDPLYRQIIDDSVTARQADYGYHTWIHYDHRGWKTRSDGTSCANVYRTGPVGRGITKNGGSTTSFWSGFTSAGPGTSTTKPNGYTLPVMTGAASLGEYSGKTWYQIPNQSWYSCWKTGAATSNGFTIFYYVFGDQVKAKYHNFNLFTWNPSDISADNPGYPSSAVGDVVAQTKEQQVSRNIYAGCLDGCGGASGSGSAEAASKLNDIAFQPPLKNQVARTYFYQRTAGATDYEIKLNNSKYNPITGNPLIGLPANTDTFWLCISLRDSATDYVYCLGTSVIKDWLNQVSNGKAPSNMNITAVTVSNQWAQDGGIVYAYDKANKTIYKFERKEKEDTPVTSEGYLGLNLDGDSEHQGILNLIGANADSELDDIKADGFGSLYFALSHPAKSVSAYDPRYHFKPNDCVHVHLSSHNSTKKETIFRMIFIQEYGKKVYQRDYLSGDVKLIGTKKYATRNYNVAGKICDEGWEELSSLTLPSIKFKSVLASWSAQIAGNAYDYVKDPGWEPSYFLSGLGGCSASCENCSAQLNYNDPGNCKLAVINVPTPPKVYSLGDKKSYLDIIGPYDKAIAPRHPTKRHTNQRELIASNSTGIIDSIDGNSVNTLKELELSHLYFYMVENYPLDDGAQDPRKNWIDFPDNSPEEVEATYGSSRLGTDWDGDGRVGGFITALKDSAPYDSTNHPFGVKYEWKTWMVLDQLGNSVCELAQQTGANDNNPYNYFYSPVFGKFIMTCRVKYNWYDYDELKFGSTIDDLGSVLRRDEYALPVCVGSRTHKKSSERLNEIMGAFTYRYESPKGSGNYVSVKFMENPIKIKDSMDDYESSSDPGYKDKILGGDDSEYWAMIPIETVATETPIVPASETALITRCDYISSLKESDYTGKANYWASAPVDTNYFGIMSNDVYFWRIDLASQTNMLKDISTVNGIIENQGDYNYIAHQMLNPDNSVYYQNANPEFIFVNNIGAIRWKKKNHKFNNGSQRESYWMEVTAYLKYKTPDSDDNRINFASNKLYEVVNGKVYEINMDNGDRIGEPKDFVYYKTNEGDIPPTDPKDGELFIEMKRWYEFDKWYYYKGQPMAAVKNMPNIFTLTGKANVRIMDCQKPSFAWDKTKPNNLFGITGRDLAKGVGPDGLGNPDIVKFTVTDNNPWEGVNSEVGLSIDEHIKNYAYNFGWNKCFDYCATNKVLSDRLKDNTDLKTYCSSMKDGIFKNINDAKAEGNPTSTYNFKPLFSKYARDTRLSFETVRRVKTSDSKGYKVIKSKADDENLFPKTTGRKFSDNSSNYAIHWHNGTDNSDALVKVSSMDYKTTAMTGEITYNATINYELALEDIKIGTIGAIATSTVPDGYANNTPGYKVEEYGKVTINPYKFYVSAVDSSGNYTGEKELNLVLNVKDDIPPIGYGSMKDMKTNKTSYFPYQTSATMDTDWNYSNQVATHSVFYDIDESTQSYSVFESSLHNDLIRADKWLPKGDKGYINEVSSGIGATYQALKSLDDSIVDNFDDGVLLGQIASHVSPLAVEDNVPCMFNVWASDNCGNATSTLTISFYTLKDRAKNDGTIVATTSHFISSWIATYTEATDDNNYYSIATNSKKLDNFVLFKGEQIKFPMALPLIIETTDDARDWDYYSGCNCSKDGWSWGTVTVGKDDNKKRIFKTTVPVYGTELDIRTLDKTIKNEAGSMTVK